MLFHSLYYAALRARWRWQQRRVGRRPLGSTTEIAAFLQHIGAEFDAGQERGRAALESRFLMPSPKWYAGDPFSAAYRQRQLELYYEISGRSAYDAVACEETDLDIDAALSRPYPYQTGLPAVVGEHMVSHGLLLARGDLRPGSRVLEIGAGWGQTTQALAKCGLDVTVVEVSPRFSEYLTRLAAKDRLAIEVHCADMLEFEPRQPFETVIFNESFHHCFDHQRMIERFDALVAKGGKVIFNAEPILRGTPYPWGLRTDGQALWAIRSFGWFELGFNASYFRELLRRNGWTCEKQSVGDKALSRANFFVARRA